MLAFAYGQTALAQQANHQDVKYWIFLKDKLDGAGKTMPVEAGYLTTRALERRAQRGTTPSSKLDAPLSPVYLDALRRQGITPLVQSRWLNAVSARLDDRQYDAVRKLPFVRELRPVAGLSPPPEPELASIPAPVSVPVALKHTSIDYGASQRQLDAINAIPALERGINGTGVRIGFLDTKYNFNHRALQHIVDAGRLIKVRDFTEQDQQFCDCNQSSSHGMSVTSVAVGFEEGQLVGPAYGAEVLAATTEFVPHERNSEEDNFVAGLESTMSPSILMRASFFSDDPEIPMPPDRRMATTKPTPKTIRRT
ncbi:MAG: hypothetical protein IH820_15345, partial [Bacteroidetes bacterium]|nr:hypothetical protein [Bacteroidota bacterium]